MDWRVAELEKRLRLEEQRAGTGIQGVSIKNTTTQAELDALEVIVAGLSGADFATFFQEGAGAPVGSGSATWRFWYDSTGDVLYWWSVDLAAWQSFVVAGSDPHKYWQSDIDFGSSPVNYVEQTFTGRTDATTTMQYVVQGVEATATRDIEDALLEEIQWHVICTTNGEYTVRGYAPHGTVGEYRVNIRGQEAGTIVSP